MRACSYWPERSNRHNSTFSAWAENSAKLTPLPSHVAPSGKGLPGHTWVGDAMRALFRSVRRQDQGAERRQLKAQRVRVAVHRVRFGMYFAGIADAAPAIELGIGIDPL